MGVLVAAASPLRGASVGVNLVSVLPSSTTPARAAHAASVGFAAGIIAPTEVLVRAKGIGAQLDRLDHLQRLIDSQPGVAGVVGPADKLARSERGAFLSTDHGAARYLVVLDHLPFSAPAVHEFDHLRASMPGLLSQVGLGRATAAYAGDTAISSTVVGASQTDLIRVGLFTLAVDFLILVLFLRSVLAPLVLVMASGLVVAAAFGITTFVFTGPLHATGFTFYAPFATEVLLISFGSDYNLYLVGSIWETARQMPFRRAIAHASAEASFAINAAGATLACSFAMLGLVTLGSFQEIALIMFCGLLIDTFLVRPFLVPAALSLLGRAAGWPGHNQAMMGHQGAKALPSSTRPPFHPLR
jgi:RND superfamily putative drug exporter